MMVSLNKFILCFTTIALMVMAGCRPPSSEAEDGSTQVLAVESFLADVTRNLTRERMAVTALIPRGMDPHAFEPTPRDVAIIHESEILIINGAGFEEWLDETLENAGGERQLIEASAGLTAREARPGELETEHENDPHFWLDPLNVIHYVENIRDGLAQFDPEGAELYQSNASAYIQQLTELDAWINEQIAQVQPERRVLITNHESFGYFAERYGFTVVGTIVQSFSSDSAPSAQQMAALIDQIKEADAPAIFLAASDNPDLAHQIAAETGVHVITDLHVESLTDGAPAGTYIDLMRSNVTKLVDALK